MLDSNPNFNKLGLETSSLASFFSHSPLVSFIVAATTGGGTTDGSSSRCGGFSAVNDNNLQDWYLKLTSLPCHDFLHALDRETIPAATEGCLRRGL